jgi:LysR substrate binding domain
MRTAPFLIADLLASGALVPILPRLPAEGFEINAFYPSRRHLSPKVRAFIDMLVDRFGEQERPFGPGLVTVFLAHERMTACHRECRKIDQSMPIAAETEPIANQRNSCFKSRAQILTDRRDGSSSCAETIYAVKSTGFMGLNGRAGVRGSQALTALNPIIVEMAAAWEMLCAR